MFLLDPASRLVNVTSALPFDTLDLFDLPSIVTVMIPVASSFKVTLITAKSP